MTTPPGPEDDRRVPHRGRLIALAGLLGIEYLIAALLFDSERMPSAGASAAFRYLGEAVPFVVVTAAATAVVGAARLRRVLPGIARSHIRQRFGPFLLAHALLYLLTLGVTVMFNRGLDTEAPSAWVALWAVSGLGATLMLASSTFTFTGLRRIARASAPALAIGAAGGSVLFLAGLASRWLWDGLARRTLDTAASILRLWAPEIVSRPDELILGTPEYLVRVDRQCSGYEGIGLVLVLLGFYLIRFRKTLRFPNTLALLPLGVVAVWLANAFRIAALIWVGATVSPAVAEGGFHSGAGWLFFTLVSLALLAWANQSELFTRERTPREPMLATPTAAYLLPLMTLLFVGLITSLFTLEFDLLYPLRVVAAACVAWAYRKHYRLFEAGFDWASVGIGVAAYLIWIGLEPVLGAASAGATPAALANMPALGAGGWLVLRVFGSVVVVPLVEELAFRGFLLRRLIDVDFERVSFRQLGFVPLAISSVAFGLLHQRWLAGTLAGLLYAYAQYRGRQLGSAVTAHATTNALLAADVLAFGHWQYW